MLHWGFVILKHKKRNYRLSTSRNEFDCQKRELFLCGWVILFKRMEVNLIVTQCGNIPIFSFVYQFWKIFIRRNNGVKTTKLVLLNKNQMILHMVYSFTNLVQKLLICGLLLSGLSTYCLFNPNVLHFLVESNVASITGGCGKLQIL